MPKPQYDKSKNNNSQDYEPLIPINYSTKKKLTSVGTNFSLYSPRTVMWDYKNGDLKINTNTINELCDQSKRSFPAAKTFLEKKHKMQEDYLEQLNKEFGIEIFSFDVQTSSLFISGLGSGHPTETGMILDRNIGVPYLPASSIKGVVRTAYAVNIAGESGQANDAEIEKYFGTVDVNKTNTVKRGQLVFMDAYPENITELEMDIMNPHFGEYYNEKHPFPTDTDNPVPIHFLVVPEGTFFTFRCYYLPLEKNEKPQNEEIKKDVEKMFETAFSKIGFGGKTAIGYGRFKKVDAKQKESQQLQTEIASTKNSMPNPHDTVRGVICGKSKKGKWQIYVNGNAELKGTVIKGDDKMPADCVEGKEYSFEIMTSNISGCNVAYLGE